MPRPPHPADEPTAPQRKTAKPFGDRAWVDRVIAGKYAVERVLGRGGMGVVLKARHLRLDEPVAIKVLHPSLVNDESMAPRMLREARAALRLSSEHIVRVMDVDTLEDGVPFMVMEYLDGTDLATALKKRGGKMPPEEVVAIAEQTCRALAEAHAAGIVHRDLKPANLFLVERPDGRRVVKLLDFGISKVSTPRDAPITKTGDILGSPRYMSPEQVRGDTLDGRADIWSVGVVLYELLAGEPPFDGVNFAHACRRVLDEAPEPLASRRPDVPPGLCAVVDRCLEKDRERRFPDALALRDALAPFGVPSARPSQISLPALGAWPSAGPPSGSALAPPAPSTPPAPGAAADLGTATTDFTASAPRAAAGHRKGRALVAVALGGLTVGLVAGVALLIREPAGADPAAPSTAASTPAPPQPQPVATAAAVPPTAAAPSTTATTPPAPAATETTSAAADSPPPTPAVPGDSSQPATAQHASPTADPPWKPPRRPAAPPSASAPDPFGERRK